MPQLLSLYLSHTSGVPGPAPRVTGPYLRRHFRVLLTGRALGTGPIVQGHHHEAGQGEVDDVALVANDKG